MGVELVYGVRFDADLHSRVFKRIVRGLFKHQYKRCLPVDCPIEIALHSSFPKDMIVYWNISPVSVGDQFLFGSVLAVDDEDSSIWIMSLYGNHFVVASTGIIAQTS